MKIEDGSRLYVTWKAALPTDHVYEKVTSTFNDQEFFWKHFRDFIPEEICLTYNSEKLVHKWSFNDDSHWPAELIAYFVEEENMRWLVFMYRDMMSYTAWHGYLKVTGVSSKPTLWTADKARARLRNRTLKRLLKMAPIVKQYDEFKSLCNTLK